MSKPSAVATVRAPRASGDPSIMGDLRVFKALSHETRVRILELLDAREYTVTELTEQFDLAQPSISRHLSILKQAELVQRRRSGQCVFYRLDADELSSSLSGFFQHFRQCSERRSSVGRRRKRLAPDRRGGWLGHP